MPKQMDEAVRSGRAAQLLPQQEFVTTVTVTLTMTCGTEGA
ncbi:hypothetical protein [Luteitalea sp.]|nr:hypothetical protein [Luteitalea sp.]